MVHGRGYRVGSGSSGFSLIELLVVIGIISILLALLLPVVARARQQAVVVRCAANLQQISTALNNYLVTNGQKTFWRGANPSLDGMDWYVYGGRETGNANTGQAGLFNRFEPRPLNPYVGGKIDVFRCPSDSEPAAWTAGVSHFDWVGNSYPFNAVGQPGTGVAPDKGLSGVRFSKIRDTARQILFSEAAHVYGVGWHPGRKTNVCLADGHVAYVDIDSAVKAGEMRW
jgi:prepilin-type N-terminal cleavage/methylation domain-containing protein/prepilin-type processing-associated H-X9-DG protein